MLVNFIFKTGVLSGEFLPTLTNHFLKHLWKMKKRSTTLARTTGKICTKQKLQMTVKTSSLNRDIFSLLAFKDVVLVSFYLESSDCLERFLFYM